MKRMKIVLTLKPIKQRIHFAPATKFFADKKKKTEQKCLPLRQETINLPLP